YTAWAAPPDIARSEQGWIWILEGRVVRTTGAPIKRLVTYSQAPTESGSPLRHSTDGWRWPEYDIWVLYDLDGKVIGYQLIESHVPNPSWFERIWDWFGSWRPPPTTKMKPVPTSARAGTAARPRCRGWSRGVQRVRGSWFESVGRAGSVSDRVKRH